MAWGQQGAESQGRPRLDLRTLRGSKERFSVQKPEWLRSTPGRSPTQLHPVRSSCDDTEQN